MAAKVHETKGGEGLRERRTQRVQKDSEGVGGCREGDTGNDPDGEVFTTIQSPHPLRATGAPDPRSRRGSGGWDLLPRRA